MRSERGDATVSMIVAGVWGDGSAWSAAGCAQPAWRVDAAGSQVSVASPFRSVARCDVHLHR